MEYVLIGWPSEKEKVDELAREYWNFKEELSLEDRILYKSGNCSSKTTVSSSVGRNSWCAYGREQESMLCQILCFLAFNDCSNQGKVSSCPVCNAFCNRQQRESLHQHDIPDLLSQVTATDLFEYGSKTHLLLTVFYSKYFELELLRQNKATCFINNFNKCFAKFGIPEKVVQQKQRVREICWRVVILP